MYINWINSSYPKVLKQAKTKYQKKEKTTMNSSYPGQVMFTEIIKVKGKTIYS